VATDLVATRLRALLHTGDVLVEVQGTVYVPHRTRFSDLLAAPEPLLEVREATVTRHLPHGVQQEIAPLVTVNRDRMLLVTDERPADAAMDSLPGLRIQLDAHQVRLLCPGFVIQGTVHVPQGGSPLYLPSTGSGRFIGLTGAVVTSTAGSPLPMFEGELPFCLVNRSHIQVVLGAAPLPSAAEAAPTEAPA
jgi:hypothetical protein